MGDEEAAPAGRFAYGRAVRVLCDADDMPAQQQPFDPDGVVWTRVSPRLATARRVLVLTLTGLPVAGFLVAAAAAQWVLLTIPALVLALAAAWAWWIIGRQVPAWGYVEREDDLIVRHGIMWRELVVVPYGRMQYVDVQAGPIDRAFDIAKVQLHTAAAATDAVIPGLRPEEASRLRDQLASRGQARLAGL